MAPLIFTAEVFEKARGEALDDLSPLVLRWAAGDGPDGQRLRDQIERAAALVPEAKRPRVLGPMTLRASNDQVKAAVGVLFLAKML